MIIWLASHPRSGNSFMRAVIFMAFGIRTASVYREKSNQKLTPEQEEMQRFSFDTMGYQDLPEDFNFEKARQSKEIYIIKTHEMASVKNVGDKFIYLIRDGREVSVSYRHFASSRMNILADYKDIIDGVHHAPNWGNWSDHVRSWNPQNNPNGLLLRFEDFTKNPKEAIQTLSKFFGLEPLSKEIPPFSEFHAKQPSHFRSGKTDSFKTEMTPDEQKYFWIAHGTVMRLFGYCSQIPEFSSAAEYAQIQDEHTFRIGSRQRSKIFELEQKVGALQNEVAILKTAQIAETKVKVDSARIKKEGLK